MIESLYFPLVFFGAVVGLCIAVFGVFYRERAGAAPLAVFAVGASLWALSEALSVVQAGLGTMERWLAVSLIASTLLPAAWLLFVLEYTGRDRFCGPKLYAALAVHPLVFSLVVLTNGDHGLVWTEPQSVTYGEITALVVEFELLFWAHQAYSYLLLAGGAFLLVRLLTQHNQRYRRQGTALLVAILVPLLMNAVYSFGLVPQRLDPSGIAYVLAALVLAVTVFETELRGVAPATREVGREAALTELDDAVLILDEADRLLDANPAGEALLGMTVEEGLGRPLDALDEALAGALDGEKSQTQLELERQGRVRYYDVRVSSLYRGYGLVSGRVLSLRDVTDRRQREQRLDVLNRLLRHNIRNELNLVRGRIELAQNRENGAEHLDQAIEAVDQIVARSNKLGRLSRMLDSEQGESIDIATELRRERETGGLSPVGGTVELDLPERLDVAGGSALIAVFEELLSNGVEHNDSEEPHVRLSYEEALSDDSQAVICIRDNGPGIGQQELQTILAGEETALQHSSGVGLWLVNWVLQRAGGTVEFENDDGCTVTVRLPRADAQPTEELV